MRKLAARPASKRIVEIITRLRKEYPRARTSLRHSSPHQLLVSTILSAQCTDERINRITPPLFGRYKTVSAFAEAKQSDLEDYIRSAGFFRDKAKNIIASSKIIRERHNGKVPDKMEELIKLPGVARKTANIVLSSAFNKSEGIAVDTHVKRLSQRIGLSREKNPNKIERDLMKIVPYSDWIDFNYILVNHGRAICKARKPDCPDCVINDLCLSAKRLYTK